MRTPPCAAARRFSLAPGATVYASPIPETAGDVPTPATRPPSTSRTSSTPRRLVESLAVVRPEATGFRRHAAGYRQTPRVSDIGCRGRLCCRPAGSRRWLVAGSIFHVSFHAQRSAQRARRPYGDRDLAGDHHVHLDLVGPRTSSARCRVMAYRESACTRHSDRFMDRAMDRQTTELGGLGDVLRAVRLDLRDSDAAGQETRRFARTSGSPRHVRCGRRDRHLVRAGRSRRRLRFRALHDVVQRQDPQCRRDQCGSWFSDRAGRHSIEYLLRPEDARLAARVASLARGTIKLSGVRSKTSKLPKLRRASQLRSPGFIAWPSRMTIFMKNPLFEGNLKQIIPPNVGPILWHTARFSSS